MLTPVVYFHNNNANILILRSIISTSRCNSSSSSSKTSINKCHKPKTLKLYFKKISTKNSNKHSANTLIVLVFAHLFLFLSCLITRPSVMRTRLAPSASHDAASGRRFRSNWGRFLRRSDSCASGARRGAARAEKAEEGGEERLYCRR